MSPAQRWVPGSRLSCCGLSSHNSLITRYHHDRSPDPQCCRLPISFGFWCILCENGSWVCQRFGGGLSALPSPPQESTIGAAFLTKTLPDQHVKFEIWCASCQRDCNSSCLSRSCARWAGCDFPTIAGGVTPCVRGGAQGHRGAGEVPQPGSHVLPARSPRGPAAAAVTHPVARLNADVPGLHVHTSEVPCCLEGKLLKLGCWNCN